MLPLWGEDGRGSLELSLFGLPVRIHVSFLLFFVLLLGSGDPAWAGAGTAVFFVSILGHELGHAMAFQAFGAPRPLIVLHGMGGYTLAPQVAGRARRFVVSAAGPVAGFAVGYAGHLAGRDLEGLAGDAGELAWLVGCVWGLGNLVPVLPLDGGRIAQELLPGTELQRLARARVLSVIVGSVLALLAWSTGYVFVAVLVAWFTIGNVSAVAQDRRTGHRAVDRPRRIEERLQLAYGALTPRSAAATEALAWEALQAAPAGGRAYPVSVLVSSLLVQQRHAEAAEVLTRVDERDCSTYLRTLVELGPTAAAQLDERLQTERPDPADLDLALLARAFAQDWDAAAALAEGDERGRLEKGWLELVTSWSFHAGAFPASARLGMAMERRDADARTSFNVACALARDGRPDEAIDALRRAASRGWHDLRAADRDEDLAPLRAHPGWTAVRARFVENARRPAREHAAPVRRPTAAAAGVAACMLLVVGLVRVLPSDPDLDDLLGIGPFESTDDVALDMLTRPVVGYDLATGEEAWRADVSGLVAGGDGERVFVTRFRSPREGSLVAIDPADGSVLWERDDVAEPSTAGDAVLVTGMAGDGATVALDPESGEERWRRPATYAFGSSATTVFAHRIDPTAEAEDGPVVEAIDLRTGAMLWETTASVRIPAGDSGVVVLAEGAEDGDVRGVDERTGAERWRVAGPTGFVTVTTDHAWVAEGGGMTRVDLRTGATVTVAGRSEAALGETHGVVVLRGGSTLTGVDTGGAPVWTAGASADDQVSVQGDGLVVQDPDEVEVLDPATGAIRWRAPLELGGRAQVAGDIVIVLGGGLLRVLDLDDGDERWSVEVPLLTYGAAVAGDVVVTNR